MGTKACSYHVRKDLDSLACIPGLDVVSDKLPNSPQSKLEAFVCPLEPFQDLRGGGQREAGGMTVKHASSGVPT